MNRKYKLVKEVNIEKCDLMIFSSIYRSFLSDIVQAIL